MKWLKRSKISTPNLDVVRLVATALALQQAAKTVGDGADGASTSEIRPSDEHHGQAQSLLFDFAMEHFSNQVEVLRREAVIEHMANEARDRLSFTRLAGIGAIGTLAALGASATGSAIARHFGLDLTAILAALQPIVSSLRATAGV